MHPMCSRPFISFMRQTLLSLPFPSGNILFRQYIRECKEAYQLAPKTQKPLISQQLVAKWRSLDPPGRFLERCEDDKTWRDVGDAVACRKTSKALGERGKRNKGGGEPSSPEGRAVGPLGMEGSDRLAGSKRKMNQHSDANQHNDASIKQQAREATSSLNASTGSPMATGGTGGASISSLLQRVAGGPVAPSRASSSALSDPSITGLLGGTSGLDLASLLQLQQPNQSLTPSSAALLLARAQQQQQIQQQHQEALLLGMLRRSDNALSSPILQQQQQEQLLQLQLLGLNAQGGGTNLASLLSGRASSTSPLLLADALALEMNSRNSTASTSSNNSDPQQQLLDLALARHILSSRGNTLDAGSSALPPTAASAPDPASLLRLRLQQQQPPSASRSVPGEERKEGEAATATAAATGSQLETLDLVRLLINQNRQQVTDPAALAALRRSLGNN